MGSWGREDAWEGSSWKTSAGKAAAGGAAGPNLHVDKPEEQLGRE